MRKYAILRFIATGSLTALATFSIGTKAQTVEQPKDYKRVELGKFSAVQGNGELYFISENGRYGIQGRLTDTWTRTELNSIEKIEYSTTHIDFKKWGLKLDQMNVISFGSGPQEVVVYVDPLCPVCKQFVKSAQNYLSEYTFKLLVVPALGDESNKLAKMLFCAENKSMALTAFIENKLSSLPQKKSCDTAMYDQTLLTAHLIDIKQVPYFISPDGRKRAGAGPQIWNWLEK